MIDPFDEIFEPAHDGKHEWEFLCTEYYCGAIDYIVRFEPMINRFLRAGYPADPWLGMAI